MFQRALVVFENEKIAEPALTYARELALRMDCEVTLLMLIEMGFLDQTWLGSKRLAISDIEERVSGLFAEHVAGLLKEGVSVTAALRVGDPAQEFLKFLAERPPFQVIVWGSDLELPGGVHRKGHWLSKVRAPLECPVLAVGSKTPPDKPTPSAADAPA